jgi:hypothetical protein
VEVKGGETKGTTTILSSGNSNYITILGNINKTDHKAGHVVRMPQTNKTYRILVGETFWQAGHTDNRHEYGRITCRLI